MRRPSTAAPTIPMMRGLVEFLVAECCTEADCASIRQQSETAA